MGHVVRRHFSQETIDKVHKMLLQGVKSCIIARECGVSSGSIVYYRRKFIRKNAYVEKNERKRLCYVAGCFEEASGAFCEKHAWHPPANPRLMGGRA